MGDYTNDDYELYVPDTGEAGPSWGDKVSANFTKIAAALGANATAIVNETTARATADSDADAKLDPPVNVFDEGFLGDGTSDDRTRLVDMLAEGGRFYFPARTYLKTGFAIPIPSNTELKFAHGAIMKNAPGSNAPIFTNSDLTNGNTNIIIDGGAFDGDRANQSTAFSTLDFTKVTHSQFRNLEVYGALRTGTFPTVSSDGEGIVLRDSNYNHIIGGYFHDNDYDGVKLRNSSHNTISDVVCVDNGRSGVQISRKATLGIEGSNYNALSNIVVVHSTGTPDASAPTTSGVYIHVGAFNTISGLTVYGTRQGIGLVEASTDNIFDNFALRTRYVDKAAIEIEDSTGYVSARNSFSNGNTRGISGANGSSVYLGPSCSLNRFSNIYFSRGDGTGTWTITAAASGNDNKFLWCQHDGSITDGASRSVFLMLDPATGGNVGIGTHDQFGGGARVVGIRNAATVPSTNPSNGGVLYAEAGALKWRGSSGTITTLGSA